MKSNILLLNFCISPKLIIVEKTLLNLTRLFYIPASYGKRMMEAALTKGGGPKARSETG